MDTQIDQASVEGLRSAAEPLPDIDDPAFAEAREERLERFIGVIYRPQTERWSHHSDAVLAEQFDAWVWFDETRAVTPLADLHEGGEPELWPYGL